MPYDPFKHHRRSIRLRGYDYTQAGVYFCTIVTRSRECLFGDVVDSEMRVNALGQMVAECWDALPAHFANVELDAFVITPNHVHGIIVIAGDGDTVHVGAQDVRATHASPLRDPERPRGPKRKSVGAIIGSFKSAATKRINEMRATAGAPVWHRNYHEHIIRNEKSLHAIRDYIAGNPANWVSDEENPVNVRVKV
jgi:REP element-mobilizing transposase RayT